MFALYLVSLHCHGDSHSQGLKGLCMSQCESLSEQLQVSLASNLSHSLSLRVLRYTIQALILSAAQPSELRAWRLHSHCHRIIWSMRTLAAFAAAAATEDRKGVLHSPSQPDCPDLATIIAILLSAKQVLQVGWSYLLWLLQLPQHNCSLSMLFTAAWLTVTMWCM